MVESYERLASRLPFQVRRRVRWSECDPAGVVYTGKFVEFMLGAVNLFWANLDEGSFRHFAGELGIDTPCRGLQMDFRSALWPDDEFTINVHVGEIRTSSFDLEIRALRDDGREVFVGKFSPICIPRGGPRQAAAIPDKLRELLAPHQLAAET